MAKNDEVTMLAVADVSPAHENTERQFDLVRDMFQAADIVFGQLEEPLSHAGARQLFAGIAGRHSDPKGPTKILADTGFSVMSFAGNHTMDRSEESMFETAEAARANGIAIAGVGHNIAEAREPVILERNGTKVGFLAYCSVLPRGYEATPNRSGVAPLRATTFYEQVDWQAGTQPRIVSEANPDDLKAMVADIEALRPKVDVLVVSCHWGLHFIPGLIAGYQREAAHAAIDAGADLLLGHHAHILKGCEVYKGKVIFYSINNFCLMPRGDDGEWLNENNRPSDQSKLIIVKVLMADKKIKEVRFIPTWLDTNTQPEPLRASDPRFDDVVEYLKWTNEHNTPEFSGTTTARRAFPAFDTTFVQDRDEVIISV